MTIAGDRCVSYRPPYLGAIQTAMKKNLSGWTLVVAANNESVLQNTLLRSPEVDPTRQIVIMRGYSSAGAAYNSGLAKATSEIAVLAHQDVFFPAGWEMDLDRALQWLNRHDPEWGVLGVFGITAGHPEKSAGHCYSTGLQRVLGEPFHYPIRAQSLDELVLIVRCNGGLRFDENLPGFHLYGSDLCLQANKMGMNCYIIPAFCIHNSNGLRYLPIAYWKAYFYMRDKWRDVLPITTCCSLISRSMRPALSQMASDVREWCFGEKRVGARCPDVVKLHDDLIRSGQISEEDKRVVEEYVSG
jgi:hypothetical protein